MKKTYSFITQALFFFSLYLISFTGFSKNQSISKVASVQKITGVTSTTSSAVCTCVVPLDTTFSDVPFSGGTGAFHSCDDGSFGPVSLPFVFCYYGDTITSIYINNNGNVSFNNPYSTFTSSPFPSTNYNMITPFWSDIDTRSSISGTSNGRVRYKVTPTSLIVKWDSVGRFPMNGSLRNSFQLTLTNGSDTAVPGGNNVSFCFGDMQWPASGLTSTTGINKGDSINYFQITRCDHDSTDYDGPYGNNDGISYLDGKSFFLTTCTGAALNVPPIAINDNCDTLAFNSAGDSALIAVRFIGPEFNQIVSAQLTPNPNAVVISNTSGVDAVMMIKVYANSTGIYPDLEIIASDNAGGTTTQYRHIGNNFSTAVSGLDNSQIKVFPNPTNGFVKFSVPNSGQLKVVNVLGTTLVNQQLDANRELILDLTSEPSGVYFVHFQTNKGTLVKKFIKE